MPLVDLTDENSYLHEARTVREQAQTVCAYSRQICQQAKQEQERSAAILNHMARLYAPIEPSAQSKRPVSE